MNRTLLSDKSKERYFLRILKADLFRFSVQGDVETGWLHKMLELVLIDVIRRLGKIVVFGII